MSGLVLTDQVTTCTLYTVCFTLLSFTAEIKLRLEAPLALLSDLQEVIKEHKAR